jgi:hypothetical protein
MRHDRDKPYDVMRNETMLFWTSLMCRSEFKKGIETLEAAQVARF